MKINNIVPKIAYIEIPGPIKVITNDYINSSPKKVEYIEPRLEQP